MDCCQPLIKIGVEIASVSRVVIRQLVWFDAGEGGLDHSVRPTRQQQGHPGGQVAVPSGQEVSNGRRFIQRINDDQQTVFALTAVDGIAQGIGQEQSKEVIGQ